MNITAKPGEIISENHSTSHGYYVEVRDNLPDLSPIVVNNLVLIGKEWVKFRPEWLEGLPPHVRVLMEDNPWTKPQDTDLLSYASAMAFGWAFLGYNRLRQVEFRLVKCEVQIDTKITKQKEFEPIKLQNYGMV